MTAPILSEDLDRKVPAALDDREEPSIDIAVVTGGFDRPYAVGLCRALLAAGVRMDVIGSDGIDGPEMHSSPAIQFLNLQRGWRPDASMARKLARVCWFYVRLLKYIATSGASVFHVLWNNKVQLFDRTILMAFYRLLGKRVVLTAHNVNAGKRDGTDSALNRATLKMQYRLADHIFVHTDKMKGELLRDFGVLENAVTVIPFGINDSVPDTDLTPAQARARLGIREDERTLLFFGAIRPYKGLEHLIAAFRILTAEPGNYRLIIAGEAKKESEEYLRLIERSIESDVRRGRILARLEFVPDAETELYFKAADVVALPYAMVFQSGVLFLAYNFGVPVIGTDVGSFRDDILEGKTGFVCKPSDPADLARAIGKYFESGLYRRQEDARREIREYARAKHSWETVAESTRAVYASLLGGSR